MPESTLFERARPTRAGYREITPAELHGASGRVRVVDVREAAELTGELGQLPRSEHAPLATLAARVPGWDRDEELVLVCRSGARSARAAEALVAAGFRRVINLAGGMLAYRAAGLGNP